MRPQIITTVALVDDANGAFEDQTTAGAADLVLDGALVSDSVVFLYGTANTVRQGQLLAIEGAGTNAGVDATITGTFGGAAQVEVLTLANAGTATSAKYWTTITSIAVDGAVDGNIEGGFLTASTTPMALLAFKMDYMSPWGKASIFTDVSSGATLNYTVQHTADLPQDDYGTSTWDADATWHDTDGLDAKTATDNGNYNFNVMGSRLIFNSYTSGTVKFTVDQGHSSF